MAGFPPTLIITAGGDSLMEEGERFRDILVKAGTDVTWRCFRDAVHGFTVLRDRQLRGREDLRRMSREAWQMMIDFVNQRI